MIIHGAILGELVRAAGYTYVASGAQVWERPCAPAGNDDPAAPVD